MRKVVFIIFMLVPFISNGQFFKGQVFIGGSLDLYHQKDSNGNNPNNQITDFSVSTRIGFLVTDKQAIGLALGTGGSSRKYDYIQEFIGPSGASIYNQIFQQVSTKFYSIEGFGQRYFVISEKFFFSLTGTLAFTRLNTINTLNNPNSGAIELTENSYKMKISGSPSFLFFPSTRWALNAGLGSLAYTYGYSLTKKTYSNFFSANYGAFSLGFIYFFKRTRY